MTKETIQRLELDGYKYVGFQNVVKENEDIDLCRELQHGNSFVSNRTGSSSVGWCDQCKIYYTFDSSD